MKSSFITWLPQCRRSDAFSAALGGKSHLIHYLGLQRRLQSLFKYPLQIITTLIRLYRDRPDFILVATPPVLATLPVYTYARLKGLPFVIDAHTGVFDSPRWTWLLPLSRWMSRRAALTIVTNEHLARTVQGWGARTLVVGTLPIAFPPTPASNLGDGIHIAVISTYSHDEPVEEVVEAARQIPHVTLHITGDLSRAPKGLSDALPPNVRLTGWLSEEAYAGLLRGVTGVMVLTTRNHTMQRGAYEAMTLEKPLIVSDWPLLRDTFSMGTIYVDNTAPDIAGGLKEMWCEHERLASEMRTLRETRHTEFEKKLDQLLTVAGPIMK